MSTERIEDKGKIIAIIIRNNFNPQGIEFVTPNESLFQVGVHNQEKGAKSEAHHHLKMKELKDINPQEFFYIERGRVKVELFNSQNKKISEVILGKGDSILLFEGHSVEFLEDSKMIEVKQGPFRGAKEKVFLE